MVLPAMAPPKTPHLPLVLLLFFSLSLHSNLSSASNSLSLHSNISSASYSISPDQSLSGTQKLISEDGNFVLGFFQPSNSSYYYIDIWYNKVSQLTPVWVANRDTPISDPTRSELKISSDGNLVIINQSKSQIWSTNTAITSNSSTIAVILDTGNLVLRDGSNSNKVYWQSFDHPTNTWLPGGKLGLNKVTGEVQRLTSWKNIDDPAPGIYSLGIDPNESSQYFILWNNSMNYWNSGTSFGLIFGTVPDSTTTYICSFQYVSIATQKYFTYSFNVNSTISRLIMDVSGQFELMIWVENSQEWILFLTQPRQQCQVYALCGPFGSCNENALPCCNCIRGFREKSPSDWALSDPTGGCVRNTPLQCGKNKTTRIEKDGFFTLTNMRLPDNSQSLQVGNAPDCELTCLNNCSCTAYSYSSSGCSVWYGDLLNLQEQYSGSGAGTLYLRLAASELRGSKSKKGAVDLVVIGGVAGSLALFVIVWTLIWRWKRRRGMMGKSNLADGGLQAFRYSDLQHVTKNFSEKLGGGGFGSVFKGILSDSTAIAVKKLEGLRQGEKQFRTEVSTIGKIHHVNLIRLHGFCSEGNKKLLVYEYMPNGSLDTQLFQSSTSKVLDWNTRYKIALGTARGLVYLHDKCIDCIIHCDIKPENILLDASFVPRVADFGLAKLVGRDVSRVLTTMRGTIGYLAPEWISGAAITAKADVYSYGMMLFELISGRRNTEQTEENKARFFPILAASKLLEGDVIGLLDHRLEGVANLVEVVRAYKVACWCIQDDEDSRPSMGQVVQILEGVLEVNTPPVPRTLQILAENPRNIVFFSDMSSNQSPQMCRSTSTSSRTSSPSLVSTKD